MFKKYFLLLVITLFLIFFIFRSISIKKLDWTEYYTGDIKSPRGLYVLKTFLTQQYSVKEEKQLKTISSVYDEKLDANEFKFDSNYYQYHKSKTSDNKSELEERTKEGSEVAKTAAIMEAQTNSLPQTTTDFKETIHFTNKNKSNKNIQVLSQYEIKKNNAKLIINDSTDIYFMNRALFTNPFNYFLINSSFNLIDEDESAFMTLLSTGTNIFVNARTINIEILDSLKIKTDLSENTYYPRDTLNIKSYPLDTKSNSFKILKTDPLRFRTVFKSSLEGVHEKIDTLIVDDNNDIIAFRLYIGKGSLTINTVPEIFSNYEMMKEENHPLVKRLLEPSLAYDQFYFDSYYKGNMYFQSENSSILQIIVNNPHFKSAYYIIIGTIIIYILLNFKRIRKIINRKEPIKNYSLELANTLAKMYMLKSGNKVIYKKMIHFLQIEIKKKFNNSKINTIPELLQFLENRSEISQNEFNEFKKLVNQINYVDELSGNKLYLFSQNLELIKQKLYKKSE